MGSSCPKIPASSLLTSVQFLLVCRVGRELKDRERLNRQEAGTGKGAGTGKA